MVPDRGIFVVADGMGGHAAGEVASEMAVRFVARELGSLRGLSDDQVADRMRTAIRAANGAIFQRTLTEHDKRGMGTTVTALVLLGEGALEDGAVRRPDRRSHAVGDLVVGEALEGAE